MLPRLGPTLEGIDRRQLAWDLLERVKMTEPHCTTPPGQAVADAVIDIFPPFPPSQVRRGLSQNRRGEDRRLALTYVPSWFAVPSAPLRSRIVVVPAYHRRLPATAS